jgi:hypothetical protein
MAAISLPHPSPLLPVVAPAVIIPTKVAPTVGHGLYGHRYVTGPITSTGRQFTTGMLVAHVSCFYIKPGSYRAASAPITHAYMLPVDSINIFIGLTDAIENFDNSAQNMRMSMLLTHSEYDEARLTTLPLSRGGSIEGAINSAV